MTPEVAAAWSEVYWLFALQLVAEEARLYQQANVDPAQPTRPYRVVRRIEETADVISLVLEPADGGPPPAIAPGQYVSVFVDLPDGDGNPGSTRCPPPPYGPACRSPYGGSEE